jgi:hypothetical protein
MTTSSPDMARRTQLGEAGLGFGHVELDGSSGVLHVGHE